MTQYSLRCLTLLLALSSLACRGKSDATSSSTDIYSLVTNGMRCNQGGTGTSADTQMVCEYSVGDGLQFRILAVGAADAGIEFEKVLPSSPYRAAMSLKHGCVIVERQSSSNTASAPQFAFVSPRTGKVYHTWQDCAAAA